MPQSTPETTLLLKIMAGKSISELLKRQLQLPHDFGFNY
jgi:hypothetical protein